MKRAESLRFSGGVRGNVAKGGETEVTASPFESEGPKRGRD